MERKMKEDEVNFRQVEYHLVRLGIVLTAIIENQTKSGL